MTIRYTCSECDSVLKIKDELAGNKAKCPKCGKSFRIPEPALAVTSGAEAEVSEADVPEAEVSGADDLQDLIDMPQEVTPPVSFSDFDEFDPMSALGGSAGMGMDPPSQYQPEQPEAPKPSVAELMREHEEKMKEKKKRKGPRKKGGLAEAAAAAEDFTSGTAADALTRTYDQKRGKGGEAPTMTREERREAEFQEAMKGFAIKAGIGILGILLAGYLVISWALSEALPDLEYVSGVVRKDGAPMVGVEVTFIPVQTLDGSPPEIAATSTGYTNEAGEFVLMYDPENEGVLPGVHRVSISHASGVTYRLLPENQERTVNPDQDNRFEFNL